MPVHQTRLPKILRQASLYLYLQHAHTSKDCSPWLAFNWHDDPCRRLPQKPLMPAKMIHANLAFGYDWANLCDEGEGLLSLDPPESDSYLSLPDYPFTSSRHQVLHTPHFLQRRSALPHTAIGIVLATWGAAPQVRLGRGLSPRRRCAPAQGDAVCPFYPRSCFPSSDCGSSPHCWTGTPSALHWVIRRAASYDIQRSPRYDPPVGLRNVHIQHHRGTHYCREHERGYNRR